MEKAKAENFDWPNLGFNYYDLPYSFHAEYKDGKWDEGKLTSDSTIKMSEAANVLHYGQEAFEGLKAYRRKDGGVNLFRPDMNAKRLHNSAERLLMAPFPEDRFVEAVKMVVKANQNFVPPYGSIYSPLYHRYRRSNRCSSGRQIPISYFGYASRAIL